jgi:hypothetical protein
MINRLLRDDPSKGRTGTKTRTSMRDIWNTLRDPGEFPNKCDNTATHRLYRINRLLVLRHDHLHTQKSCVTISRT